MASQSSDITIGSHLTADEAEAIFAQGKEAVVFVLLQLAKQLAEAERKLNRSITPSTPSGMIPVYEKPTKRRRESRPGAKPGHPGSRRESPSRIDERVEHRAARCPDCGGDLNRCAETRVRYIEDIPEVEPKVTEHTIHRDWCPRCRKKVEPVVASALTGAVIGNRVMVLSAWLHYALGNTLSQIVDVFNFHMQMKLSEGGLVDMWYRLQEILFGWYEQIQREANQSAVLHADETGWRVKGQTHWLWCFCTQDLTYYLIDRSRGSPALAKFFTEEFEGTLVSDFWSAYNSVCCPQRQTCLVHLLRELEATEKYKKPGENWPAFQKKLRRLLGDAIRLWRKQSEMASDNYESRCELIIMRLDQLIATIWDDRHAERIIKRLRRHQDELFTFLRTPDVPFENNHAERSIRPAVIIRKNSYGNRSDRGADCQAVMMSVFRTLKQRGHDPIRTVVTAIEHSLRTNELLPLPGKVASDG